MDFSKTKELGSSYKMAGFLSYSKNFQFKKYEKKINEKIAKIEAILV